MKPGPTGLWTRIAFRFLVRSGRATAALSVMVVAAVAALVFLSALAVGVEDAMLRNTVGLFSGHVSGYDLPDSVGTQELVVSGVNAVLKRIYLPGILSRQGLSLPLVLCGIDPGRETALTALDQKVSEGRYPSSGQREILISRYLAEIFNVRIGESMRYTQRPHGRSIDYRVSGIYSTGLEALDRGIAFCPLDMLPVQGASWSAAVFLENGVLPDPVLAVYRQRFPAMVRFESWEAQMPDLRQLIDLQVVSMVIVIFLVFGVVAIGIACSFVIFIIRNLREYGILKAMGVSSAEMWMLIVSKVALMNLFACAAGLVTGVLAVLAVIQSGGLDLTAFTSHNRYFAVSGVIYPRLTVFSLWAPPATSLVFSLVAAIWPAVLIARRRAADILRLT